MGHGLDNAKSEIYSTCTYLNKYLGLNNPENDIRSYRYLIFVFLFDSLIVYIRRFYIRVLVEHRKEMYRVHVSPSCVNFGTDCRSQNCPMFKRLEISTIFIEKIQYIFRVRNLLKFMFIPFITQSEKY